MECEHVSMTTTSKAKSLSFCDGELRFSSGQVTRDTDPGPTPASCSVEGIHLEKAALIIDEGVTPKEAIELLRVMLRQMKDSFEAT